MPGTFTVGEVSAEPGTSASGGLKLFTLPDGTLVQTPIVLINGAQSGAVLYVGAATHGDEVNGIEICRRVVENVDPKKLTGSIIIVPVHNPIAFWFRRRFNMLDGIDLNRVFPGREQAGATETLAHKLYHKAVSKANCIIDFHSASTGGRYCGAVLFVPDIDGGVGQKSLDFAKSFGGDVIVRTKAGKEYEGYILDKMLTMVAASNGIPGFCAELGTGNLLEEEYIEAGARGVGNVMKALGMTEGLAETSARNIICEELVAVRARCGGLLRVRAKLGTEAKQGDILGEVYAQLRKVEDIVAPVNGLVVRTQTMATVLPGDRVVCLGR